MCGKLIRKVSHSIDISFLVYIFYVLLYVTSLDILQQSPVVPSTVIVITVSS